MSVRLKIVQIGNSQGVRLPKLLLQQCEMRKEVDAEAIDGVIVLRPTKKGHRHGWAEAFREMAAHGDDRLLDLEIQNDFDERDWQWK